MLFFIKDSTSFHSLKDIEIVISDSSDFWVGNWGVLLWVGVMTIGIGDGVVAFGF